MYWHLKRVISHQFRCLGKNKNGTRCKKTFLTSSFANNLTCHLHKDQDVTFQYGPLPNGGFKDVAGIIAKQIDDPATFRYFAMVCKSTAKACHMLQTEMKNRFKRIANWNPCLEPTKIYVLPNRSTVDSNNNYITYGYSSYKYSNTIVRSVNGERRVIK